MADVLSGEALQKEERLKVVENLCMLMPMNNLSLKIVNDIKGKSDPGTRGIQAYATWLMVNGKIKR